MLGLRPWTKAVLSFGGVGCAVFAAFDVGSTAPGRQRLFDIGTLAHEPPRRYAPPLQGGELCE